MDEFIIMINEYALKSLVDSYSNADFNYDNPLNLAEEQFSELLNWIPLRRSIITEDEKSYMKFRTVSYIRNMDISEDDKNVLGLIYSDISTLKYKIQFEHSCDLYNEKQPLFTETKLYDFVRKNELININALNWINDIYFKSKNKILKANGYLNTALIGYMIGKYKGTNKFIRIDPFAIFNTMPLLELNEEVLRPANPKWLDNLMIHNGREEGAHYYLPDINDFVPSGELSTIDELKLKERAIKGILSLEVYAGRNNNGTLHMSVEELSNKMVGNHYYISRMIHLDTDNPCGTDFNTAVLNHIDLAINAYDKDAFEERTSCSLSNGKVTNATRRIHLMRFEQVPFRVLFELALLFFESHALLNEWLGEQIIIKE